MIQINEGPLVSFSEEHARLTTLVRANDFLPWTVNRFGDSPLLMRRYKGHVRAIAKIYRIVADYVPYEVRP